MGRETSGLLGAVGALIAVFAAIRGLWSPCGLSMVSTLNPLSERSRGHRYPLTAAWFVAGAALGGAVLGGVAALGAMLWAWIGPATAGTVAIAAGCCLVATASDTSVVSWRLPLVPRQVNEQWVDRYRRWIYAAGFGLQIGVGVATYVMTAAVYLTFTLGVLTGSPEVALAVGILFGAVRGCAILVGGRADDPQRLRRLHARLARLEPWSLRMVIAVELLGAAAFTWALNPWVLPLLVLPVGIAALRVSARRTSVRPGTGGRAVVRVR